MDGRAQLGPAVLSVRKRAVAAVGQPRPGEAAEQGKRGEAAELRDGRWAFRSHRYCPRRPLQHVLLFVSILTEPQT